MPVTTVSTAYFFKEMIESYNRLNIMVISKHELKKISSISSEINKIICNSWRELQSDSIGDPKISLIAIGDCMAEESLYAKDIINSCYPDFFVRVLAVEDLSLLESPKHSDIETFRSMITDSSSCVWVYNGYPKTIKGLLWDLGITANTNVLGYKDYDRTNAGLDRFSKNEVSRFHIANEAIRLLLPNKNIVAFRN
jgi:xylulose-5-phosphate/fructose-6-phosphate phosphoketolase